MVKRSLDVNFGLYGMSTISLLMRSHIQSGLFLAAAHAFKDAFGIRDHGYLRMSTVEVRTFLHTSVECIVPPQLLSSSCLVSIISAQGSNNVSLNASGISFSAICSARAL